MQAVLERARVARERLTLLLDEDVRAFGAVMAAYALPRASAEETRARSETIQAALHAATLVPLACARDSGEVMELSRIAAEKGEYFVDYGMMSAAIVFAVAPMIVVYLFLKDRLSTGLAVGAVKG